MAALWPWVYKIGAAVFTWAVESPVAATVVAAGVTVLGAWLSNADSGWIRMAGYLCYGIAGFITVGASIGAHQLIVAGEGRALIAQGREVVEVGRRLASKSWGEMWMMGAESLARSTTLQVLYLGPGFPGASFLPFTW